MSASQLVLATRNRAKIAELRRILDDVDLTVQLLDERVYADLPEIPETGSTFAANALLKARAVAEHTSLPAVADDSGICVDALNGMPGVLSARWAGRAAGDEANLRLLLEQLADVPDPRRGAQFVCAAAVCLPDGTERVVEGNLAGVLIRQPEGEGGFGYDPIFRPNGEHRTTAQMSPEDKDAISHRGRAFRAIAPVIAELLR